LGAQAEVLPHDLKIQKVLDSFVEIADLAESPNGELWVLERTTGTVRVFVDGLEAATMTLPVQSLCDEGLLDVAFSADYVRDHVAFVSYVDTAGRLRVDRAERGVSGLVPGPTILDLGTTSGCRAGGGLVVGPDAMLYVGVGDLEVAVDAQDDASLAGKVLRVRPDGSIPADNPDPSSAVFAKGFRNPADLALNPDTARIHGTLYANDLGAAGSAADEVNAVAPGGNHGWAVVSGDSGGSFDDPLVSYATTVNPLATAILARGGLGPGHSDRLVFANSTSDELRDAELSGADLDMLIAERLFYDPDGDRDGTPDATCPRTVTALTEGNDGLLYLANHGSNPGICRVWEDRPGPREVSSPGSPFLLGLGRQGEDLLLTWERLDDRDVGRPARNGGQHVEAYRIWEGSLSPGGFYDHVPALATDGAASGAAALSATITPSGGDRYYLVSAQGDNLEGSTGVASDGTERDASPVDYCTRTTDLPIQLVDYNPTSPTYLQALSMRDFRGKVVHFDLSSNDCFWCNAQAPTYHDVDLDYRDRDFVLVTVLSEVLIGPSAFPNAAACAAGIADWASRHGEETPVLCDVDLDGNGKSDVTEQFWHGGAGTEPCGVTPQNFFIDQGGVFFDYRCGFTPGTPDVSSIVAPEVNPETCE
jgi:hypothetical protein